MPFDVNSWRKRDRIKKIDLTNYVDEDLRIDAILDGSLPPLHRIELNGINLELIPLPSVEGEFVANLNCLYIKRLPEVNKFRVYGDFSIATTEVDRFILYYNCKYGFDADIFSYKVIRPHLSPFLALYREPDLNGIYSSSAGDINIVVGKVVENDRKLLSITIDHGDSTSTVYEIKKDEIYKDGSPVYTINLDDNYHLFRIDIDSSTSNIYIYMDDGNNLIFSDDIGTINDVYTESGDVSGVDIVYIEKSSGFL